MAKSSKGKKPGAKKKSATKPSKSTKGKRKSPVKGASKSKGKVASKKKAPAKAKANAPAKTKKKGASKTKAKKAATPRKPKVSQKKLLFRRFDTGVASKSAAKSSYKKPASVELPEAPPFVTGRSKKQVAFMRALLMKNFDLKEAPAAKKTKKAKGVKKETKPKSKATSKALAKTQAKAPAKAKKKTLVKAKTETPAKSKAKTKAPAKAKAKKTAAPKKAKVSMKELLFRQYGTGATNKSAAKSPHKKAAPAKLPEAPPFVVGQSEAETEKIRALLFKVIDLKAKPEVEDIEKQAPTVAPVTYSDSQPPSMAVKLGLSGLAILLAIIVAASYSNRNSFFLKNSGNAVEVWQGKFAPSGSELILTLEGMKLPNPIRDVYTKSEVYRLVFDHLEGKADTLLYDPVGPDFSQINKYLRQAATYAPSQAERRMAQQRLDSISLLILFHKIDVALIKGTLPELEAAKASLEKGADYASSTYQRDLIAKRRAVLDSAISQVTTQ